jgi:CMP-N-acetylneuraminic acid synthetase
MKFTASFGVRSGSVRVPNKNIRPFGDTTLLELKIKTLQNVNEINNIVVSSDSDEMLKIVQKSGAISVKRSKDLSLSSTPATDLYKHLGEISPDEYVIYSPCTSPLIQESTYRRAIECYKENVINGPYDCVISYTPVREFLWDDNGPVNYTLDDVPRSQDLPEYKQLNFAFCIIDKKTQIEKKTIVGSKPYWISLDKVESIDIDNPIDFYMAEIYYKNRIYKESDIHV